MWITPEDLAPFASIDQAKAVGMIEDAEATAVTLVPSLETAALTDTQVKAVRAILRRAILRWHEQGNGAFTQETDTAGPMSHQWTTDTRTTGGSRGLFWPSEVADLERIAGTAASGTAFTIDQVPTPQASTVHPFRTA